MTLQKTIIATKNAPQAVGPYSQATRTGDFVFTAGQVALDQATGKLVEGTIETETHKAIRNLTAVLEASGSSLAQVVKTTVFMTDISDFQRMNAVYAGYFTDSPPARSTVQVAALPMSAQIEIECVALVEK